MAQDDVKPIKYSLGSPRARTGLGGLPAKTTAVIGIGAFVALVGIMFNLWRFGITVVIITAITAALVHIKLGGRSLIANLMMMVLDQDRRRKGEDTYVSGALSNAPGGTMRLPGTLARTRLVAGEDVRGRPFAAIVDDPLRLVTVVFEAFLAGQSAMTAEERNDLTAAWGGWLASLSLTGDIEAASVTVQTRPGSGQLLRREVSTLLDDNAPELARRIMWEATENLTEGIPELAAHVAVTVKVDPATLGDDSFIDSLATRLPAWYEGLSWAGVQAEPMDEVKLTGLVHTMFVPAADGDMEQLLSRGVDHCLAWEDSGPSVAQTRKLSYHHEGVVSRTWEMEQGPRAAFEDTILRPLCAPHGRVPRKRVTLIYRPFEAGKGAHLVEAEHRDAMVAANNGRAITKATAMLRLELTEMSRAAQARGAQLGRFSLFVTATATSEEEMKKVAQDVQQLGAASSIRLRPMSRQQDAGFAIACGIGELPWKKDTLPKMTVPGLE